MSEGINLSNTLRALIIYQMGELRIKGETTPTFTHTEAIMDGHFMVPIKKCIFCVLLYLDYIDMIEIIEVRFI